MPIGLKSQATSSSNAVIHRMIYPLTIMRLAPTIEKGIDLFQASTGDPRVRLTMKRRTDDSFSTSQLIDFVAQQSNSNLAT